MTLESQGKLFKRNAAGYEAARKKTVWHQGLPNRFPAIIVQAKNQRDIIAAVQIAKQENLQIAIVSGGHSWSASHLRDNTLLLDLSSFKEITIDRRTMTATAEPGIKGSELAEMLRSQDLYFPVGHCKNVCIGGYLLEGGFAWRGRELGPSCMSVIGIDVVTANGDILYADENQNADLFWAARGSGPGFFAIVTRFHLKLYPLQKTTLTSFYLYPPHVWEEYLRWSRHIEPSLPSEVEVWNIMYRDESVSTEGPIISASVTAFTDTEKQARQALAIYETCPVRSQALVAQLYLPTTTSELTLHNNHYPSDKRFIADNMWTHASFDELLPGLRAIHKNFPAAPTHMVWFPWNLTPKRPDMAYSLEDEFYIALYAGWDNSADDQYFNNWVTNHMRIMEKFATGIQLADENLINRPRRFMTNANMDRLDKIRAQYDPDNRFVSWLGKP